MNNTATDPLAGPLRGWSGWGECASVRPCSSASTSSHPTMRPKTPTLQTQRSTRSPEQRSLTRKTSRAGEPACVQGLPASASDDSEHRPEPAAKGSGDKQTKGLSTSLQPTCLKHSRHLCVALPQHQSMHKQWRCCHSHGQCLRDCVSYAHAHVRRMLMIHPTQNHTHRQTDRRTQTHNMEARSPGMNRERLW